MTFRKTSILAGVGIILAGITGAANAVPAPWNEYSGSSFFETHVPPGGKPPYDTTEGIEALTKLLSQFSNGNQSWPGDLLKGHTFPGYTDRNTSVPEPATLTLMGIGLLGTAAATRRRKKLKN